MLEQIKNIYFIGIGGIGMSALARWFNAHQYQVAGYDRTPTTLTTQLQQEGIDIHFDDNVAHIPEAFTHPATTLIVYTPAVPAEHKQLNYFKEYNFQVKKRAEVLGFLTQDRFTVAVAGTHGKTSTSSMIAHIIHYAKKNCTAFLGGILQEYESNLILSQSVDKESVMVVEADEYDRSFLHLHPNIAVLNSVDADHLDIYGNEDSVLDSYVAFIKKIKENGRLFIKKEIHLGTNLLPNTVITKSFALEQNADCQAQHVQVSPEAFYFDFNTEDITIQNIKIKVPGYHNIINATVAIAVALELGIDPQQIRDALAVYKGVKRRFEYILQHKNIIYIDDYAHHPTEIEVFLKSVKAMYPNKKITAIFQPHLFTRTRDFLDGFAKSLSLTDQLVLLDIYPAREQPIQGITSQLILDKVTIKDKTLCGKNELYDFLQKNDTEVVLTIGAGDIGAMVDKIGALLNEKYIQKEENEKTNTQKQIKI
ncbi:UDP-N-acetylmuramate--L-alanine ligase [uncultured Microscilla sp.]|uniref:UDP-N-acetylmuramate--L-alanine ligase n=1 Tax=uncultured Microscilla sp. TaxID=432653 RepID=UPI002638DA92|nr:UDP-N-acetylmuramate--L-alanine ligase [uncultured Microscilla sp.]